MRRAGLDLPGVRSVDLSTRPDGGGSGLGLTIARSIAQAHDGTISAAALRPDGLKVDVFLPRPE